MTRVEYVPAYLNQCHVSYPFHQFEPKPVKTLASPAYCSVELTLNETSAIHNVSDTRCICTLLAQLHLQVTENCSICSPRLRILRIRHLIDMSSLGYLLLLLIGFMTMYNQSLCAICQQEDNFYSDRILCHLQKFNYEAFVTKALVTVSIFHASAAIPVDIYVYILTVLYSIPRRRNVLET